MSSTSVLPGLCHTGADDRLCWLSGRDCDGVFISGMDMLGGKGPGADCPTHKKLMNMPLGACTFKDTGGTICSPNIESCTASSSSSGVSFTGSIPSDQGCVVETTKFGSCQSKEAICRYSPEECPNSSTVEWTFPYDDCTCDKVIVGACIDLSDPSRFVCAVNEEACDTQYSLWVPTNDVRVRFGTDCFLCQSPATSSNPIMDDQQDSSAAQNKIALTALFVVVAAVVVLSSVLLWFCRRERRLRQDLLDVRLELQEGAHYSDSNTNDGDLETKEII